MHRRVHLGARPAAALRLAAAILGLVRFAAPALGAGGVPADAAARAAQAFRAGNLARIQAFLDETGRTDPSLDDYYFALVGDIQNSVRSLRHDVFDAIARDMRRAVDDRTGQLLYDKIRFVVLLGDLVYEGPSRRQWEALARAFAGQAPEGGSYPGIAGLVADKPIFPAIGNHELLDFRLHTQTRYQDLFDSPKGAANLRKFFDWDRFIADPRILYPVPSDIPVAMFRERIFPLPGPDRELFLDRYVLKPDGRYHLKFYERAPGDSGVFEAEKTRLAAELAPVFRKAGYGTLPVLNSDNMVLYAFEAGHVLYVFLDSMSRGWQYPNFVRFKEALHPEKKDVHRLNLFSISPYNGQAGFYRAAAAYARDKGETLVVLLHHSFFNSSKDIHGLGTGYNAWLGLGFPQAGGEKGNPTLFDEILFKDASNVFTACVHGFEHFSIVANLPGRESHVVEWQISGGGGGPPRKFFYPERIQQVADYFNARLRGQTGPYQKGSIEVRDDKAIVGYHYIIAHVRGGRIVDISRHVPPPEDMPRRRLEPRLMLAATTFTRPWSTGASLQLSPGVWSMEPVSGYLTFINWRPSVTIGWVGYNAWRQGVEDRTGVLSLEISPFDLECHLPRANVVTLELPGLAMWDGPANRRRYFLTMGVEAPLIYDIAGVLENLNFGLKAYVPFRAETSQDPEFGARTKLALSVGYRFRLR